ncbi:MAG: TetR family transcriptional regulator [Armatimonadetes bacterium]|nr:TetR family transcriptional regulator [Armatimonadota bacterium]
MGSALTLSELVRATGVSRSTVQFYTRRGLLPQPAKTQSGRCLYSEDHVQLLRRIAELKVRGWSVAEIKDELEHVIEHANQSDVDLASREYERIHHAILRAGIEEFVSRGYDHAHLATIIRNAGITPYLFYAHFPSKARLLVECFDAFVIRNETLVGPRVDGTADPGERLLYRLTGNLRARALAADAQMVVRLEESRKEGDLRKPVEEAWQKIIRPVARELAALRPAASSVPTVPDELVVLGLSGAFDATYMRSIWDDTYGQADLLSAHLWLFLAVQAAVSGEIEMDGRMARYDGLIQEVATHNAQIPPSFDVQGFEGVRGRILHAATVEFVTRGYESAHVSAITQEAGVTPHVFYAHFPSKARLLAECFNASVKWNAAFMEPQVARTLDHGERYLRRLTGSLRTKALGADVLAFVRVEGMREESDLREPLEEAWGSVVSRFVRDLAAMRSQTSSPPAVADELIAFSLLGAFDATYGRLIWDDAYGLTDVLSTNLWLFLAVQAAMRGEIDLGSRLSRYGDLVEEIAHSELSIASLFGDS